MPSPKRACERMRYWCEDANLGYDQSNRWDIRPGGETDCSALVIHVLREAGFDTGSASYTGDMSYNLTRRGWKRLPADLSTARPGDILLNDTHHVALVIAGSGWGATIGQASIDERGMATGGQSGDQSGRETNTRPIYEYGRGWDCILRYEGPLDDDTKEDDVIHIRIPEGKHPVYRAYNEAIDDHFLTSSTYEFEHLPAGYVQEGIGFTGDDTGLVVYRLVNPHTGQHHYTISDDELDHLVSQGWVQEDSNFAAAREGKPVYRIYNPNTGAHHWPTGTAERDSAITAGWNDEGIAWHSA